jgi:putative tricarboxylic transport membrane protein
MEQSFRRAFKISNGSLGIFFKSPLAIVLVLLIILSITYPIIRDYRKKKKQ